MLTDNQAIATVPVKDLKMAANFYESKLGLQKVSEMEGQVISYKTGNTTLMVYKSEFAGGNKATDVTWVVPDVEKLAAELKTKGVTFEHYDMPNTKREGDVYSVGNLKNAWFKDPDGNIHNIVTMKA